MRLGVVGVGHMGWLHARNVASHPSLTLAGVTDVDTARATRAASDFETRAFPTIESLCEAVDGVVVAAPTSVHHEAASLALANGRHVFVEKPVTRTVDEATSLERQAAEAGRVLAVGHVERFNPVFRALESELADPVFVEAHRLAPFVPRSVDVDVILDLMIHDLDLVLATAPGTLEGVEAAGVSVVTGKEDIANVRLAFSSAAVANLTASRVSRERKRRIRFFTTRGYFGLDLMARTGDIVQLAADPREWIARGEIPPAGELLRQRTIGPFPDANPLADELLDFVDAARTGRSPVVDGDGGRKALDLAVRAKAAVEAHLARVRGAKG